MLDVNHPSLAAARSIPGVLRRIRAERLRKATTDRNELIGCLNALSEQLAILLVTSSTRRATTAASDHARRGRERTQRRRDVGDLGRRTEAELRAWKQARAKAARSQSRHLSETRDAGRKAVAGMLFRYARERQGYIF